MISQHNANDEKYGIPMTYSMTDRIIPRPNVTAQAGTCSIHIIFDMHDAGIPFIRRIVYSRILLQLKLFSLLCRVFPCNNMQNKYHSLISGIRFLL